MSPAFRLAAVSLSSRARVVARNWGEGREDIEAERVWWFRSAHSRYAVLAAMAAGHAKKQPGHLSAPKQGCLHALSVRLRNGHLRASVADQHARCARVRVTALASCAIMYSSMPRLPRLADALPSGLLAVLRSCATAAYIACCAACRLRLRRGCSGCKSARLLCHGGSGNSSGSLWLPLLLLLCLWQLLLLSRRRW